jgi:hypothetical protein
MRKLTIDVRRAHMLELVIAGTVPLTDPARIAGILDPMNPKDRLSTLAKIEDACRRRADQTAMVAIARWRAAKQQ